MSLKVRNYADVCLKKVLTFFFSMFSKKIFTAIQGLLEQIDIISFIFFLNMYLFKKNKFPLHSKCYVGYNKPS